MVGFTIGRSGRLIGSSDVFRYVGEGIIVVAVGKEFWLTLTK